MFEDIFKKFKECLRVYSLAQYIQIALNWSDHDLCKCIKEMGEGVFIMDLNKHTVVKTWYITFNFIVYVNLKTFTGTNISL